MRTPKPPTTPITLARSQGKPTSRSLTAVDVRSSDPAIRPILDATFPSYRKPTVTVRPFQGPKTLNSYWDGGSKREFRFYSLPEKRAVTIPTSHPYFDRKANGDRMGTVTISELPEGWVIVEGGTFLGKTAHITICAGADNLAPALAPPPVDLSAEEASALTTIASIKGGCRDEYFRQGGLGPYGPKNRFVEMLRCRNLVKVNKAGAVSVTPEGRNVVRQEGGY